ncbi:RING/U-box superfamily protein [Striga asiatica]|uniref:RING/U-box superfamily protein n=1 Tax=Striga asiatica TaxID=4170 RepID=A0A5A7PTW1_STRAF|nr:RING/U-box superfamily protein [Striga asiatica]
MALGYDEEVALRAILKNEHVMVGWTTTGAQDDPEPSFADLMRLEECSLASMVCPTGTWPCLLRVSEQTQSSFTAPEPERQNDPELVAPSMCKNIISVSNGQRATPEDSSSIREVQ